MKDSTKIVKEYYDQDSMAEWNRLDEHPFEFLIAVKMMERYIKPGDKILDIGGGPGRYSLYFAKKGYDVTLVDLSDGNVELAYKICEREELLSYSEHVMYIGEKI